MTRPAALALLATMLTGCAAGATAPTITITATPSATVTITAAPSPTSPAPTTTPPSTPTPTPTPTARTVTITCYDKAYNDVQVTVTDRDSLKAAWKKKLTCNETSNVPPVTPLEKAAYRASGYTENNIDTLYGLCASTDDSYASLDLNDGQAAEVRAMLMLCPDHPQATAYRAAIARGATEAAELADGRRIPGGTHLVGEQVQPGTYTATDITDCYWERQDSKGQITDNGFHLSAPRVEVTIKDTDYAFYSTGCGQWRRQ